MVKVPLHTRLRRRFNRGVNRLFSRFVATKASGETIEPGEVRRILLVRPNYRIGNMLFLTPLLNALGEQLPDAKVDLLVGMRSAGAILEPLPNVGRVYDLPRKLLRQPMHLRDFIRAIRGNAYDVVLNLMPSSTSSQIVTLLAKGHYKASFYDENSWCPLTHTVRYEYRYPHMALRPLEMVRVFGADDTRAAKVLDIKLRAEERAAGQAQLEALLQRHDTRREGRTVIGLFRNARFDKRIPDAWWQQWYEALKQAEPSAVVIDILSPDIPEKLNGGVFPYAEKSLRGLGAFMAALDGFVCGDTGPMHLAAASGATTLALFNKTETAVYGTLGEGNLTIDMEGLDAETIVKRQLEQIARNRGR